MGLCVSIKLDTKNELGLFQNQHSLHEASLQNMAVCNCEDQVGTHKEFTIFPKNYKLERNFTRNN
jgi:hypothetical protein